VSDAPVLMPVFLKLGGRTVLVVGAGTVAERKIAALLEAGATVRVVAPGAIDAVQALAREGRVEWRARRFEDADLDEAWLVMAATDDAEVQRLVSDAAAARRVFCIAVDDPAHASAYSGAVVRRPPFAIAISSSGAAPALTRLVREVVEGVLPGDDWIEHARALRARWLAEGTPMQDRFDQLVRELRDRGPRR
jgi:uroporphyrin-III C-methyltransferase / precorrin-2 dehydrogenase / sirohydrochlorin ferrochelatase